MANKKIIYTIGHSTHTTREFIQILKSFNIQLLVDIRHYPGSKYCPQFGKARLRRNLLRNKINYLHQVELGGRRHVEKGSLLNIGWRSLQFRGYADYMQTKEFKAALKELIKSCKEQTVAIMCAEAVPWRCHRSMVGDALIVNGFTVLDIFAKEKARPHALTTFAKVSGKKITYPL
ncbi:MAG: DUF488 domain-containing protein [Bacteriovorax sp.]|nr:DUF488 domain-containing protein [Bacteriovorax sp.]